MCNIPPWNNLWGALGIGAFYDFDFVDQDICYKVLWALSNTINMFVQLTLRSENLQPGNGPCKLQQCPRLLALSRWDALRETSALKIWRQFIWLFLYQECLAATGGWTGMIKTAVFWENFPRKGRWSSQSKKFVANLPCIGKSFLGLIKVSQEWGGDNWSIWSHKCNWILNFSFSLFLEKIQHKWEFFPCGGRGSPIQ